MGVRLLDMTRLDYLVAPLMLCLFSPQVLTGGVLLNLCWMGKLQFQVFSLNQELLVQPAPVTWEPRVLAKVLQVQAFPKGQGRRPWNLPPWELAVTV